MVANIHQVVSPSVEPKQLAIQHVRNPGKRMPVALVTGRERPGDGGPGQPALNGWVFINVGLVVAIDEGSVTSMGLLIRPRAKKTNDSQ